MTIDDSKETLVECLRLLAAPPDVQIGSLPDYVDICHEVLSAFAESFLQLPSIVESGILTNQGIAAVLRCFNWIDYISRQKELMNIEALKSSEAWDKSRVFAQMALVELGENIQKPNLKHINFIEG